METQEVLTGSGGFVSYRFSLLPSCDGPLQNIRVDDYLKFYIVSAPFKSTSICLHTPYVPIQWDQIELII